MHYNVVYLQTLSAISGTLCLQGHLFAPQEENMQLFTFVNICSNILQLCDEIKLYRVTFSIYSSPLTAFITMNFSCKDKRCICVKYLTWQIKRLV